MNTPQSSRTSSARDTSPDPATVPFNLAAEQATLAGLLLADEFIPIVRSKLKVADFFRDIHQTIYREILALADSGSPVDPMLLITRLEEQGEHGAIGDDYLAEIVAALPHAENTAYYAAIVHEKALARRAIVACEHGADDLRSGRFTARKALDRAARRIEAVRAVDADAQAPGAQIVRLSDVRSEAVSWLWPQRIPSGMLTLLMGDPSVGKSFVTLGMAATVSLGARWPDPDGGCAPLGSSLILTAEDSLSHTVRPRLDRAGANVERIHALTTVRRDDGALSGFMLSRDMPLLETVLDRLPDCRLLVIDPISAYLGEADEHRNAEVRGLIAPLSELAERRSLAVVLVTHLNKGSGTKALYRATGSLAFVAASRMAWLVVTDHDDRRRQLLLPIKDNISEWPAGLAYRINDGLIEWETEPVTLGAEEALAPEKPDPATPRAGRPVDFLANLLPYGSELPSEVVITSAKVVGINRNAIFEAKKTLGIGARKVGGRGGAWFWFRPGPAAGLEPADEPDDMPF